MKTASKTAIGSMIAALCLALMLSTAVIPFLSYAIPMISGAFIMIIVIECDKLWALFVYIAVAILSLLIVPDKSAGLAFAFYFGYYPILKAFIESKDLGIFEYVIKYSHITAVVLIAYFLMLKFFGIDTEGIEFLVSYLGKWYSYVALAAFSCLFFFLYDNSLTKCVIIYQKSFRKKFRKLFK